LIGRGITLPAGNIATIPAVYAFNVAFGEMARQLQKN
jgi:hypothetical protein